MTDLPRTDHRDAAIVPSFSTRADAAADHLGLDVLRRARALYPPTPGLRRTTGLEGPPSSDATAVRAAVRRLAAAARRVDPVRAERLLIVLRQAWQTLPPVERRVERDARALLWDRLVALCCEEFYAPGHAVRVPAAPRVHDREVAHPVPINDSGVEIRAVSVVHDTDAAARAVSVVHDTGAAVRATSVVDAAPAAATRDARVHAAIDGLIASGPLDCDGVPVAVWRDAATRSVRLRACSPGAGWLAVNRVSLCDYFDRLGVPVTEEAVQELLCHAYRRTNTVSALLLITQEPV